MVLTIGSYLCRAACRTDWAPRENRRRMIGGYLLIASGYAVLGVTLDKTIHRAVEIWATETEEAGQAVLARSLATFLVGGFVGAYLVHRGAKAADEIKITTVESGVHA